MQLFQYRVSFACLYFIICSRKDLKYDPFPLRSNPLILFFTTYTEDLSIDQGGFYPTAIYKKLLRAISPKIGNFVRAIKSSRDHVCASADAIASNGSCKRKRPEA